MCGCQTLQVANKSALTDFAKKPPAHFKDLKDLWDCDAKAATFMWGCPKFGVEHGTGWWFGTFFIFPYIGNNHPN